MSGVGRYFPGSAVQRSSLTDIQDKNPLLNDEKNEPKGYGAIFTICKPVRSESGRQIRTYWMLIAAVVPLLLIFLLSPIGCITTDFLGNLRRYILVDVLKRDHRYYPNVPANFNSSIIVSNQTIRIVLLGDSLISRPYKKFNLVGKMKNFLSQYDYTFEIFNCGFDGSFMANTKLTTLGGCALPRNPHVVIVFSDADCSNTPERSFSEAEVTRLRNNYVANLKSVLTTLKRRGIFVALTGMGILGEGMKVFAPKSERFKKKEGPLNIYNKMNEDAAADLGIPFINVRKALLKKVPFYQLCYKHCVTYDGEHQNDRGAIIIAKMFSDVISAWLTSSS